MPVRLPPGVIATPTQVSADAVLAGSRVTRMHYDLLDNDENVIGELASGEAGGSVTWTANASIKAGGQFGVVNIGRDIDWLNTRVRVWADIAAAYGAGTKIEGVQLGVYIPAVPVDEWSDSTLRNNVDILDKTSLLDQDIANGSVTGVAAYSVPAGANVIARVVDLIEEIGESAPAIQPATVVTAAPMVWDIGTTRLRVINDLLDAANYFSLYCDGAGQYRVDPYVEPSGRAPSYEQLNPFTKGETSLMDPSWSRENDIYSVPNRYVCIGVGDGDLEAMVGIATNTDPASPYSYANRGNRWITTVDSGVEAVDQAAIDAIASRRLAVATSVTQTLQVAHPLLPDLTINDIVVFTNPNAKLDRVRTVVTSTTVPFDELALCKSTLRVVQQ